jgi:membrane protein required for colicin V production
MNPLDLAVIGILALSAIFAFARGFVREALSIVAWVGAAAITLYGFTWLYAQVEPRMHDRLLSQLATGFGLFVTSLIVLTILTSIVARAVRGSGLSPIDRIKEAKSEPSLHKGADVLKSFLPEWLKAKSATAAEELIRNIDPKAAAAAEAEKARGALSNPTPAVPPNSDSAPAPSYRPGDQRQLDRVIGTQR